MGGGEEKWEVSVKWGQSFSLGRRKFWEMDDGELHNNVNVLWANCTVKYG